MHRIPSRIQKTIYEFIDSIFHFALFLICLKISLDMVINRMNKARGKSLKLNNRNLKTTQLAHLYNK